MFSYSVVRGQGSTARKFYLTLVVPDLAIRLDRFLLWAESRSLSLEFRAGGLRGSHTTRR